MKQTDNWQEIAQGHIESGQDIKKIFPNSGTAIHNAVYAGFPDALPVLINKYGVDVNQIESAADATPLHYVATYAEEKDSRKAEATAIKMADILIKAGADIDALDLNGATPLHYAFGYGSIKMINFLIDAGADQTITNRNNKTPFQMIQSRRGNRFFGSVFFRSQLSEIHKKFTCVPR